jgi:5-formyltetrahydrofolate cyclo-ligase
MKTVKETTISQKEKHLIRKRTLEKRLKENKKTLQRSGHEIIKKLLITKVFQEAVNILFYTPIKNEVDTKPLIELVLKKNKNVLVPRVENEQNMDAYKISSLKDLEKGTFGILEAKRNCKKFPKKDIDLVIVPGVAFDISGHRIGFGQGYYDAFLNDIKAKKIALAYDFQIVKNIPDEEHDVKMDLVITPSKTIHMKK